MYKRTEKAIINNPPKKVNVMCKAQFGKAEYSDIAYTISTRIDSSGAYCLIVEDEK